MEDEMTGTPLNFVHTLSYIAAGKMHDHEFSSESPFGALPGV
jgi:hypothetical protein